MQSHRIQSMGRRIFNSSLEIFKYRRSRKIRLKIAKNMKPKQKKCLIGTFLKIIRRNLTSRKVNKTGRRTKHQHFFPVSVVQRVVRERLKLKKEVHIPLGEIYRWNDEKCVCCVLNSLGDDVVLQRSQACLAPPRRWKGSGGNQPQTSLTPRTVLSREQQFV